MIHVKFLSDVGPKVLTANGPVVASLRVGFFTESYRPIVNGIVASIDALRGGLSACGHDVSIIAPSFPDYVDNDAAIVRIPSLPLPTPTFYRLCVPYVRTSDRLRVDNLSIVHTHSPFVTGWMGARYARRHNIPLIFTYHTRIEEYAHYVPFERATMQRAAVTLTRTYANAADAVIVPTRAMEVHLRKLGVVARIAVVPSAIDVERFAAGRRRADIRAELGAGDETKLILFVSRLAREKNLELALGALARIADPDVRLAVVGDGPHRARLERYAQELGVADRVHFAGGLVADRLPDVYASADAFVFPSTSETQGLVLAEALAARLPVVAVESAASREVLGGSGYLTAANAEALAAGLQAALGRNGSIQSAVHLASSRYTVAEQTARILDLYGEVLTVGAA